MRTMMDYISRICLSGILLLAMNLSVLAQGGPGENSFSTEVQAQLQKVLNDYVSNPANGYVGGMSAAIKIDDLASWQGAAGYASRYVNEYLQPIDAGEPFSVNTPSQIYSVTKTFTAALVLELVKEGVLSLDAPISKYIDLEEVNPLLNDVTIHQLLAHETGYTDFWFEPVLIGTVAQFPEMEWDSEDALALVHQGELEPGVRSYSSTNYIMLGYIVEQVTSIKIEDHFRERFFGPLDLNTMYLGGREDAPPGNAPLAAPHDNLSRLGLPGAPPYTTNLSFMISFDGIRSLAFTSGGIISTVGDLAEWGSALFGGEATSKETLRAMLNSIDKQPDEDGDYLGYGLWRSTRISETETFIGHDGNAPGYRSVMFYQPERRLTIAILANDNSAKVYELAKALFEVLLEDFYCGNDDAPRKIELCHNGKVICVDYPAAVNLVQKGAALGVCPLTVKPGQASGKLTHLRVHPNPVDNRTMISFVPEQSGQVTLQLYDVNGMLKQILFEGAVEKGVMKQVTLERGTLKGGVYFVRLQTAAGISQHKIVLNR
ncbi:MAG TPA: serine hydrolase [Chitinophagaceae bacterium]